MNDILNTFAVGWVAGLAFAYLLWFGIPGLVRFILRRREKRANKKSGLSTMSLADLKSYHATAEEVLALAGEKGDRRTIQMALEQLNTIEPELARRQKVAAADAVAGLAALTAQRKAEPEPATTDGDGD